jgi:hypothetical protein
MLRLPVSSFGGDVHSASTTGLWKSGSWRQKRLRGSGFMYVLYLPFREASKSQPLRQVVRHVEFCKPRFSHHTKWFKSGRDFVIGATFLCSRYGRPFPCRLFLSTLTITSERSRSFNNRITCFRGGGGGLCASLSDENPTAFLLRGCDTPSACLCLPGCSRSSLTVRIYLFLVPCSATISREYYSAEYRTDI